MITNMRFTTMFSFRTYNLYENWFDTHRTNLILQSSQLICDMRCIIPDTSNKYKNDLNLT